MTTPDKPTALPVTPEHIPQVMKDHDQWVLWKFYANGKKWTKPPYGINDQKIDITNPNNWLEFPEAYAAYEEGGFDGIGFVLTKNDPFVAIDLDHCFNDDSGLNDFAQNVIDTMKSYTEFSPSGDGVHILAKGEITEAGKSERIEIYDTARYMTVTGQQIGDYSI